MRMELLLSADQNKQENQAKSEIQKQAVNKQVRKQTSEQQNSIHRIVLLFNNAKVLQICGK